MLFGIPLVIWFGFLTIIGLFAAAVTGVMMVYFRKPVLGWHKVLALLTVILAVVHAVFAFLLWLFGIAV